MNDPIKKLPDSELEVMQAVWRCEAPVTRKKIEAALPEGRAVAVTTLLTLLTRLGEKGFLRIEKAGRGCEYIPLVPQREYLAAQGSRFIQKLCGGKLPALACALCDSGLSREELAELRRLLEENSL